ncbi:ATP-dependent helicase [Mycoplasma sp. Pen4]|uniref:AAA domain-containing protein n=1 Tax=Mycoplasma sp. Pen4 TaxID=640330 RepID=UPI0016543BED|nr:AAA domain-containing protein [Mycoplasma sp. Pen4]QNM93882.1 ATP-dependent helicase [Mycoplasma sp. Pen4]
MNENSKYKVILDNLLDVSQNDSSIFTKINNKYFIDLYSLVGENNFEKMYKSDTFEISALDNRIVEFIKRVKNITNGENLALYMEKNDEVAKALGIKYNAENIREDYEYNREKILNQLELKLQKSLLKWKLLNDKVTNILDETNIWPLHIGFLFVSFRKDDKAIYAPLFLKEATITFSNGKPNIKSEGDIKVNEKLLFFLNNNEFNINIDTDFKDYKIESLMSKLKEDWENLYELPKTLAEPFNSLTIDEIQNENLRFYPGSVLGIYQPWGGYSRNRMKDIILNDEMDDIIKVEFNKNVYKNVVNSLVFNPDLKLFRITPSNLSQDKAILSALNQNTVIWGPPGTGKSQTIVNILTNILFYGKTAIVASQKKAALEVIRHRMESLAPFCLFILNSKEMKRKTFYKPIKEYLDMLENFNDQRKIETFGIVSKKEIEFISKASEYLNDSLSQNVLKAYFYIKEHQPNFDLQKQMDFLLKLPRDLKYPDKPTTNTSKEMLRLAKLQFFPFIKKYYEIKKIGQQIDHEMPNFDGSFADLMNFIKTIGFNNVDSEYSPFKKLNNLIKLNKELAHKPIVSNQENLRLIITEMIFERINNFNEEQKRLYREFAQSVRINNLEPYRFVKKYSQIIKLIYPIIIATPNTDLSGWSKNEFDYAILDESSQIFIENALPILYLAKIKILAGDTEQMKPSNWFGIRYTDDSIFGQVESVLDYALSLGVHNVMLDKNYRSNHAALMTYSSKYFYDGKLDVLDSASVWNDEPIEVFQVDGKWENTQNIAEAKLAIDKVIENLDKYNKIILLSFNSKQAEYITNLIYRHHPQLEEAIHDKKLLIRNIENIQGDEADLVVATVAYDKDTKLNSTYVCRPGGKNALNVTISRAKDKMIIVKTIMSDDVTSNGDMSDDMKIFKKWLEYLEMTTLDRMKLLQKSFANNHNVISNTIAKDEWFKDLVFNKIKERIQDDIRFEIFKNYTVGSNDIDLVVTFNKIPFKCICFDTFNYANSIEQYAKLYDAMKFLKSKQYDLVIVNPLNWIDIQNDVKEWFNVDNLVRFQEDSINNKTHTYIINKYEQTETIQDATAEITSQIELVKQDDKFFSSHFADDSTELEFTKETNHNDAADTLDNVFNPIETKEVTHETTQEIEKQAELVETSEIEINDKTIETHLFNEFDLSDLDKGAEVQETPEFFENSEEKLIEEEFLVDQTTIAPTQENLDVENDEQINEQDEFVEDHLDSTDGIEELINNFNENENMETPLEMDETNNIEVYEKEVEIDNVENPESSKVQEEQNIDNWFDDEILNTSENIFGFSAYEDEEGRTKNIDELDNQNQTTSLETELDKETVIAENEEQFVVDDELVAPDSDEESSEENQEQNEGQEEILFNDEEDEADDEFVLNWGKSTKEIQTNKETTEIDAQKEQEVLEKLNVKNSKQTVNQNVPSMSDATKEWIFDSSLDDEF